MAIATRLAKRFNGTSWDVIPVRPQMDSVTRWAVSDLGTFATWLSANSAQGMVGEVGWSNDVGFGESAQWNAVGAYWLAEADRLGLDWQAWVAGPDLASSGGLPTGKLSVYYTTTKGGVTQYAGTQAPLLEARYGTGTARRGVNMSSTYSGSVDATGGAAATIVAGGRFNNLNPGTRGTDYWYPVLADYQYLASRGVRAVSLRIRWERIQPTLGAALNAGELAALQASIAAATSAGLGVVVCLHNGWGYLLGSSASVWDTFPVSQNGPVTIANLVDVWTRLSAALKGTCIAYDIMNEPHFPSCGVTSGSELLTNPSFDTDLSGWTVTSGGSAAQTTSQAHSGAGCAQVTTSSTLAVLTSSQVSVTPGAAYQAQGFFKGATNSTRYPGVSIVWYDATGRQISEDKSDGVTQGNIQWRTTTIATTAPALAKTAAVRALVRAAGSGEVVYVDDMSFKACSSPLTSAALYQSMSQQVVTAIRGNADTTELWVQIADGATVASLPASPTAWITDPSNKIRYCIHCYFDRATSGGGVHSSAYAAELTYDTAQGY
jgi:hypothetical protein